jgi:hypothetical protein
MIVGENPKRRQTKTDEEDEMMVRRGVLSFPF